MNESEYNAAAAREIAQCYEDIREKDAEIERLKTLEGVANASNALACQQMALVKDQIKRLEQALQHQDNVIIDKDAEIERLKGAYTEAFRKIERLKFLITRSIEALSYQSKFINDHCCDGYPECGKLIAELRKAAE